MNFVVDFGNTLVKLAVFDKGELVAQRCMERLHPSVLEELLSEWPARRAVVASTRGEAPTIVAAMLRRRVDYLLEFTSGRRSVPIGNAYLTPETLGRDRLAAAVGATALYPGENVLIVDFGTAVTIDLVTADNTFRGGCISPGVTMRFRALHDYTAKLPLCAATGGEGALGAYDRRGHRTGRDERDRLRNRRLRHPHAGENRRLARNFYRWGCKILC